MNLTKKIPTLIFVFIFFGLSFTFIFVYFPQARESARGFIGTVSQLQVSNVSSIGGNPSISRNLPNLTFVSGENVLSNANLRFNLPATFASLVTFEENITAPNIVYTIEGGAGIEILGTAQEPVIENTGVLSLENLTGNIDLVEGDNINLSSQGNAITISAEVSTLTEGQIEQYIFDNDNTLVMGSGGFNLPALTYFGSFPSQVLSGPYTGITKVGTLNNLSVAGELLLQSAVFTKEATPQTALGKVYFNKDNENLYIYTSSGWISLTAGGITYSADGLGIELNGTQFSLELNGQSLSKDASGLKIADNYQGQSSITTVGNLTSGTLSLNTLNFSGTVPTVVVSGNYDGITGVGELGNLKTTGNIVSMGSVGIGTSSPTQSLQIEGGVRLGSTSSTSNVLDTAPALNAPSGSLYWGSFQIIDSSNISSFGISSISGTQNQILVSPTSGNVTLSLSNTLIAPGTFNAVSGVYSGTGSGFLRLDDLGNLLNINNITATGVISGTGSLITDIVPGGLRKTGNEPSNSDLLSYDTVSGSFKWTSLSSLGGINYWQKNGVTLSPLEAGNVLSISSDSGPPLTLINSGTGNTFFAADEANDSSPFVISQSGSVGIGTSSPSFPLDVSGRIGINSKQTVYVPNQSSFFGTLVIGNGGNLLTNSTSNEGRFNTVLGFESGANLSTGFSNLLSGYGSGQILTSGFENTFLGTRVGFQSTTALKNTAVGYEADMNNQQGSNNVMVGYQAGYGGNLVHSKSGSVMIGYQAGYFERNSDRLYIENSNSTQPLIWGDFLANKLSFHGSVGIGTTNPGSVFSINNLGSGVGTAVVIDASGNLWKDSSSIKYKTNITPLNTEFEKILSLEPVKYSFKSNGKETIGFIAEDIDKLGIKDLVVYNNLGDPEGVRYDRVPLYLLEIAKKHDSQIKNISNFYAEYSDSKKITETNTEVATSTKTEEASLLLEDLMKTQLETPIASISSELKELQEEVSALKSMAFEASASALIDTSSVEVESLSVLGDSNLYNVSVTGNFSAGLITVDGLQGALNTLGAPLKLQSEKISDVEIMGGEVVVKTNGDVDIKGSLSVEKIVVNQQDAESLSAGEAVIMQSTDSVIIKTKSVTNKSLIYVTFSSNYNPATRFWIENRVAGEYFLLKLDKNVEVDSRFSWWIVD